MANQHEDIISYFNKLDRSLFIDEHKEFAYLDEPLPIGHEQTISQPSLVLKMTLAINIQPHSKVLEAKENKKIVFSRRADGQETIVTITCKELGKG